MTTEERHALEELCKVLDELAPALVAGVVGAKWLHAQAVAAVRSIGDTIGARDGSAIARSLRVELEQARRGREHPSG